jgi:hypothetical protein
MRRNPFNEPIPAATPLRLALLVGSLSAVSAIAAVNSFGDITHWVGSGANESALVIDFNDGSAVDSFAWGYRWDDPVAPVVVSGADMIVAIAADDPNLSISYSGTPSDGFFLTEVTYRSSFSATNGDFVTNFDYWNYSIAGGTAGDPPGNAIGGGGGSTVPAWTASPAGPADESFGSQGRILADGSWDAFAFGSNGTQPSGPIAPAPEPRSVALVFSLAAGLFAVCRRRRGAEVPGRPSRESGR